MSEYDGQQYVGIDLHRFRSVIMRQDAAGEQLSVVRIENDPMVLMAEVSKAGPRPEVVLEATYGWYWAADALAERVSLCIWRIRWGSRIRHAAGEERCSGRG